MDTPHLHCAVQYFPANLESFQEEATVHNKGGIRFGLHGLKRLRVSS